MLDLIIDGVTEEEIDECNDGLKLGLNDGSPDGRTNR